MDCLETLMKVDNILQSMFLDGIIFLQQLFNLSVNVGGCCGFHASHFVRQSFIVSHSEPGLSRVRGAGLEYLVKLFDERFSQFRSRLVNDKVYAAEVVSRFNDIVHLNSVVGDTYGVSLEDISCLVMGQAATLDVVGVIGEVNLDTVIDTSLNPSVLLLLE